MEKKPFFLSTVVGYTRFVLFGRGFLWLAIVGLIALMVYVANDKSETGGGRLVFSGIKQMENLQNVMMNPHYQGLDKDNMPYSIIAEKATQIDADTVNLSSIQADLGTKNGKWLALHSGAGVIKIKDKQLTLTQNVDMFYDGGYEFRTNEAFVDMQAGRASGTKPVQGQGPLGTLAANTFEVTERGKVIKFNGSVRVILYRK